MLVFGIIVLPFLIFMTIWLKFTAVRYFSRAFRNLSPYFGMLCKEKSGNSGEKEDDCDDNSPIEYWLLRPVHKTTLHIGKARPKLAHLRKMYVKLFQ
jgi:hypothetical protein